MIGGDDIALGGERGERGKHIGGRMGAFKRLDDPVAGMPAVE